MYTHKLYARTIICILCIYIYTYIYIYIHLSIDLPYIDEHFNVLLHALEASASANCAPFCSSPPQPQTLRCTSTT